MTRMRANLFQQIHSTNKFRYFLVFSSSLLFLSKARAGYLIQCMSLTNTSYTDSASLPRFLTCSIFAIP